PAVEIAIEVNLQQCRGMVSWATRQLRHNPIKAQRRQIQFINEGIDDADRVILPDVVVQAIRQQDQLAPVLTLNKPLHPGPPEPPRRVPGFTRFYTASGIFTHTARRQLSAAERRKRPFLWARSNRQVRPLRTSG